MATITKEEKHALMSAIGVEYKLVNDARLAAEKALHADEVSAAVKIKELVSKAGPGPHKMAVPTGSTDPVTGQAVTEDFIVSFRRTGDKYKISAESLSAID